MAKGDQAGEGSPNGVPINRGLVLASGVLLAVGGILGATGLLLGAFALITATRQWIQQLEQPPAEIAKTYWQQARAAGSAAASAWQEAPGQ